MDIFCSTYVEILREIILDLNLEESMKAYYKGEVADVWEIGKDTPQPDWVKEAFQKNYISWLDENVRILMTGLNPSLSANLKIGATGTAGGGFAGYGMYVLGYPGDYLDRTNHQVVSSKRFQRDYELVQTK